MRLAVAGGTGTVGRHVVDLARERGHDVTVLSRATGVDLQSGVGLDGALVGVDAVIDVASVQTQRTDEAVAFFSAVTEHVLDAERAAGVAHHIALSIIGVRDGLDAYYAGKAAQERLVTAGAVPWSLLRAAQFHEFAAQVYGQVRVGPVVLVPVMRSRPVAARDVARRLVELAEAGPSGRVADLAGPERLRMSDIVRRWARATGRRGPVVALPLPGASGRAMRDGSLEGGQDAQLAPTTFEQWLRRQPRAEL